MSLFLVSVWSSLLIFFQSFVSPTNVIPLAMSEVCLLRKPMSFFSLYLEVEVSGFIALRLHIAHDEISKTNSNLQ